MYFQRYLHQQVQEDLAKKMVFLGGPRQVGKTTFTLHLAEKYTYLNWDVDENRTAILHKELGQEKLLVFDELHKYKKWRNYLKGLYDQQQVLKTGKRKIIVTGSARLDYYRYSGDSLQGRYFYLRLLPLSYKELLAQNKHKNILQDLFKFSGFPEPFLLKSEKEIKRWSREYKARLIREDLREIEKVEDLASMELLAGRIPECVGSPLSINSLREDLQVAHKTLTKWLNILERVYYFFRIKPWGYSNIRAIKKEQKAYCYDWTLIQEESFKFENLIAVHLLKYAYWQQDTEGRDIELYFYRDRDDREVDFVLAENKKPVMFVECKLSAGEISRSLKYLKKRFPEVPAFQVHYMGEKDYVSAEGIHLCPAQVLLEKLI